jgi:UPF0148 protein
MSDDKMKDMADLLRKGATMLSYSCPECQSPLFKLKTGEIWCANCQKRVVIVPDGKETTAEQGLRLESLEEALVAKLASFSNHIADEDDPSRLKDIAGVIDALLTALEKLRRVKQV